MNFVEALRIWSAHLENYFGGRTEFWQAQGVIAATVKMYDALAPDWSQAPEGATHFVVNAEGYAEWLIGVEPQHQVAIIGTKWSKRYVWATEPVGHIDLPLGIDWRLCKWERP